jgi:large subunit ribosomal protein L9
MQIILTEDVPNLGHIGDLVTVKPGYGRNYLIPRGYAVLATPGNKKQLDHMLRTLEEKRRRLRSDVEGVVARLYEISLTIPRQAGDDDRLFGSVTNRDIETELKNQGHEIDRRRIALKEPIKALGIYEIPIRLHADVTATIKLWVCVA